jgi:hypothetical protein
MVVCDEIQVREEEPGVFDLVGVRGEILAADFPHVQRLLCVYAQITGHEGHATCRAQIIRAGTEEIVHSGGEIDLDLQGPLVMIPAVWWLERCTFPEPGIYYIQLYFGSRLANERFLVLSLDEG